MYEIKQEKRGRKPKKFERKSLVVPISLIPKFKREILEYELKMNGKS